MHQFTVLRGLEVGYNCNTMENTFRPPDFSFTFNLAGQNSAEGNTNLPENLSKDDLRVSFDKQLPEEEILSSFVLECYGSGPIDEADRIGYQNWLVAVLEPFFRLLKKNNVLHFVVLDKICLADGGVLGEVIFQIQRERGLKPSFTGDKGHYVTGGKTVSYIKEGTDRVCSTVIFNWGLFNSIIGKLHAGEEYENWELDGQMVFNFFIHELGHAIDFFNRDVISTDSILDEEDEDWEKMAEHYAVMVFDEFMACLIAAPSITSQLMQSHIEAWQSDAEEFTQTLLKRRFYGQTRFSEVSNVFWILLMQLGKLIGNAHNHEDLPEITFLEDDYDDEETKAAKRKIISDLSETLYVLCENYPDVPSKLEITEKLKSQFLYFASIYNFYFREEDVPKSDFDDDEL